MRESVQKAISDTANHDPVSLINVPLSEQRTQQQRLKCQKPEHVIENATFGRHSRESLEFLLKVWHIIL